MLMMSQPAFSAETAWRTAVHLWMMVTPCGFTISQISRTAGVPAVSSTFTPLSMIAWA